MTERRGRRARWTVALVVAPAAAGIFGAATSWASHASPVTAAEPAPVVRVAAPAVVAEPSPELIALRRTLTANRRQLLEVQSRLVHLRTQLKALGAPVGAVSGPAGVPAGAGSGSSGGVPVPAPQPVVAPPPAPPPVQAKTGSSGAKK